MDSSGESGKAFVVLSWRLMAASLLVCRPVTRQLKESKKDFISLLLCPVYKRLKTMMNQLRNCVWFMRRATVDTSNIKREERTSSWPTSSSWPATHILCIQRPTLYREKERKSFCAVSRWNYWKSERENENNNKTTSNNTMDNDDMTRESYCLSAGGLYKSRPLKIIQKNVTKMSNVSNQWPKHATIR